MMENIIQLHARKNTTSAERHAIYQELLQLSLNGELERGSFTLVEILVYVERQLVVFGTKKSFKLIMGQMLIYLQTCQELLVERKYKSI